MKSVQYEIVVPTNNNRLKPKIKKCYITLQKEDPGSENPEPVSFKYFPTAASAVITRWVATTRAARASSSPLVAPLWTRTARALRLSLPAFCFGADERRSSKVAPSITVSNCGSSRCNSNSFMVRCHGVGRITGWLGNKKRGVKVWLYCGLIL